MIFHHLDGIKFPSGFTGPNAGREGVECFPGEAAFLDFDVACPLEIRAVPATLTWPLT